MDELTEPFVVYVRKVIEDGKVIFQKKFNKQLLDNIKRQLGSYEYSCNYENNPINEENQHFKPPVRYWSEIPDKCYRYITIDLAISDKTKSDYTVIMDTGMIGNQLFVIDYIRRHMDLLETVERTCDFLVKSKSSMVTYEKVAYQAAFENVLKVELSKRGLAVTVEGIVPKSDKFSRTIALQPYWESGNLLLKQGMIELEDEFVRFPVSEHDDCLDALSLRLMVREGLLSVGTNKYWVHPRFRRENAITTTIYY